MTLAARYFPLRAAGFASNPFRALTDDAWADVAVLGADVQAAFEQTAAHVQLLGPEGAGKTTSLLGLRRLAQDGGVPATYAYIAEGQDALPADAQAELAGGVSPRPGLFLLDEAQRLSERSWRSVLQRLAAPVPSQPPRLVLSAHADQARRFAAAGLPLVTVRLGTLDVLAYRAMLDRRLAAAALPGRAHATLTDDAVTFLIDRYGPNRRAAEWLLYEVFQRLRAPVAVNAASLRAFAR